jgi:hypothetical protein
MDYVNNWSRGATLAPGATSLALDLPDGTYRLTLTDSASAPTRWEIVDAVVVTGSATLTRAQEGTADQDWPSGSLIYCSVTAGLLNQLFSDLLDMQQRLTALEAAAAPAGALTDAAGAPLTDQDGITLTGVPA